jgi:hypothetical protein
MKWEPYEPGGNEEQNPNDALLHRKYTLVQVVKNGNTVTRLRSRSARPISTS